MMIDMATVPGVLKKEEEKKKQYLALAKVENVEVAFEEYTGEFKDFEVREFGF